MEETVIVEEVITRPDGSIGVGNSFNVTVAEAIEKILAKEFKAEGHPIGVIPDGWNEKVLLPVV